MTPEHLHFGGGAAETAMHPLVVVYLILAIVLILALPRGKAIVPFLVAFFTIPIGQVVVLGGLHFTALRILILAGLVRWAIPQRSSTYGKFPGGFNAVDRVVLLWSLVAEINWCLLWMNKEALTNQFGNFLDTTVGYLVVRFLIPDGEAVRRTVKALAAICAINGIAMINEKISNINVFGLWGGIPLAVTVRDEHIRAAGVMGCLYAGAFAGVLIPLFIWLWKEEKSRVAAFAGFAGATAMVITSYSSTSYLAYGGALLGLAFWPLRRRMRTIRSGLVVMLVGLHLAMKAPVWALIARIDLTGSSSGEQRYMLVDMTIRHFSDWWLLGTKEYVSWGWDSWDLCNQFVAVALTGGLLALIFYIAIFKISFGSIGTARKLVEGNQEKEWMMWCLGSSLFATLVAHFGINYMAQLIMGFFPLVVCISVASQEVRQASVQTTEEQVQQGFGLDLRTTAAQLRLGGGKRDAKYDPSPRPKERLAPWMKA